VDAVLGAEIEAELAAGGDHPLLPVLQDLTHADAQVKRLLAPRLLAGLAAWPAVSDEEGGRRWAHHLDQVLRILYDASQGCDRLTTAAECARRFAEAPTGLLALVWLCGLFRFDPERGAQALEDGLATLAGPDSAAWAIRAFAYLFGGNAGVLPDLVDPSRRAAVLGRLVRCAYEHVRPADDRVHDGIYKPDARDDAEKARMWLFSALLDTPGPQTHRVLLDLAKEPFFADSRDRLCLLARRRAADDAEFAAFTPAALVELEKRYEAPPHDRDGLFAVMLDRLEDLAHDVAHDDFSDRRTLRTITDEAEMQRTLAGRLRASSRGAYVVTREDEVADLKRTDIRLASVRGEQKATIEVKIADNRWSLSDLEHALRHQLVGQYLRPETSKAGCLLLTFDGAKRYWVHPATRDRLGFPEMVAYLNEVASAIEREHGHVVRVAAFGLDLTDPVLVPAHRR
jgi:hypothetical protein